MIKVPGTPAGIPAFRQLMSEGININVTLLFAQEVYEQVAEAYLAALRSSRKMEETSAEWRAWRVSSSAASIR